MNVEPRFHPLLSTFVRKHCRSDSLAKKWHKDGGEGSALSIRELGTYVYKVKSESASEIAKATLIRQTATKTRENGITCINHSSEKKEIISAAVLLSSRVPQLTGLRAHENRGEITALCISNDLDVPRVWEISTKERKIMMMIALLCTIFSHSTGLRNGRVHSKETEIGQLRV